MKRSKKALALFLALVMCIGVLAGWQRREQYS